MGLTAATLNGHRVTSGKVTLPEWGAWYADVSVDGEVELTGRVEVKIADLTLQGAVLSGGPAKGRSHFSIIAGAGGWGKKIARKSYATDLGVRISKVVRDAANEVGEPVDEATLGTATTGPAFVRPEGLASRVLQLVAPGAWHVGEDGVTRLGKRAASTPPTKMTLGPIDRARGTVTIASESIASLLPGVVVEGLEAADVMHEISADGLRTTIWTNTMASLADGLRELLEQLDPDRRYRGVTEYRIVDQSGDRLELEPVRKSTGMPDLRNVLVRPGVPGVSAEHALGSYALVGFVDSDPGRPVVLAFQDAEGEGFQPTSLSLHAGGMAATEHLMTLEATVVLLHNVIVGLGLAGFPPAWLTSGVITGVINAALAASAVPAPPTAVAQLAASAGIGATMLTSMGNTVAPYAPAIALAIDGPPGKTANESGLFPSLGAPALKGG